MRMKVSKLCLLLTGACTLAKTVMGQVVGETCSRDFLSQCQTCELVTSKYNCSLPGLQHFAPGGQYEGVSVSYLNMPTEVSSPHMPGRALEFEECTGARINFFETSNLWEDAINDLGSRTSRGNELYDGYFTSYSISPGFSSLGLLEALNDRIRRDNERLHWEDFLPNMRKISEYRKDGTNNIDFLLYDCDALIPILRLDLFEAHGFPIPNTWEELVEIAKYFHGRDLNEDGEPDFGLCHFPRFGSFSEHWWQSEAVLSTWASYVQLNGLDEGYVFDVETMEPRLNGGFRRAVELWKALFDLGVSAESKYFMEGRCAIGYAPPGTWKRVFLNGVKRVDANNTVVWRPTMKSGEYAEPYRFKTYGTTEVWDSNAGKLVACTKELCPKAEVIPPRGHHGDNDRASVLNKSPLAGRLINRSPLYWAGGLGTMIRKSSEPAKKDALWDFFVYTNSATTSVNDVATVNSWMDSWRFSQLSDGSNFESGGWSSQAFQEHKAIQTWSCSSESNGALNIRIPGVTEYSRDVLSAEFLRYVDGDITVDDLVENVRKGWNRVSEKQGLIEQLQTYRAALRLDSLTEVELCKLHRELMDERDPSVCRLYDEEDGSTLFLAIILLASAVVVVGFAGFILLDRRREAKYKLESEQSGERDEVMEVHRLTRADNLRVTLFRVVLVFVVLFCGIFMSFWSHRLLIAEEGEDILSESPDAFVYSEMALFGLILILFALYDWMVRVRNQKLVVSAAKSSEVVTSLFPGHVRDKVLDQTKTNRRAGKDKHLDDDAALAELYPNASILFADICGFTAWSSTRTPEQVFQLLQSVFGTLDEFAKRLSVYKIETVGDCYVAATGVPVEQPDHCLRMCRFAFKAMGLFRAHVNALAMTLGPDTAELQLRAGIHTGQITAGVLRGDRARFQLFGDAVNVTARMESTSEAGMVQVSREVSDVLLQFHKEHWIRPRDHHVVARGKGILDTFWLVAVDDDDTTRRTDDFLLYNSSIPGETDLLGPKSQATLIEWNVNLLKDLVKKIVAFREEVPVKQETAPPVQAPFELRTGHTFLEEVEEIIELPQHHVNSAEINEDNVELPELVVDELRVLVSAVSDMYLENPFHNFEHASHVTMSVIKLLSRIVKPSQIGPDGPSLHDHSYGITSDPLTQFACAFASLVHDANHPGVPNALLLEEDPTLASRFQHRSIAEQNSLLLTLNLLSEDRFANLHATLFASSADQHRFRSLVVNSVLATDIVDKDLKQLRNNRWETAFADTVRDESKATTVNRKATIVIEHLIQASDVAHTMQHWNIYRKWNERLFLEMHAAFKAGRSTTDPSVNWVKGEIGFFDFYILPLAKKLKDCGCFGVSSDEYYNYALQNRRKWENEGSAIVAEMIERLTNDNCSGDDSSHEKIASRLDRRIKRSTLLETMHETC